MNVRNDLSYSRVSLFIIGGVTMQMFGEFFHYADIFMQCVVGVIAVVLAIGGACVYEAIKK